MRLLRKIVYAFILITPLAVNASMVTPAAIPIELETLLDEEFDFFAGDYLTSNCDSRSSKRVHASPCK